METQQDTQVRMVALVNLKAMCKRISGHCHRYWIHKISRSRVHVAYSNPNEYGRENPMYAVFPCFPSGWHDDKENPRVILEFLRVINDTCHGEGWQMFQALLDCPILWRVNNEWKTREEIEARMERENAK